MTELFNVTLEGGVLTGGDNDFDGVITDGGDMSCEVGAALAGTGYGAQFLVDDTVSIYGGMVGLGSATGKIRHRFYLDTHGLGMAELDMFIIWRADSDAPTAFAKAELLYKDSTYKIRCSIKADNNAWHPTSDYVISDAEHYIEIYVIRATNATSNDGSVQLWMDGVDKETVSGVDNYDKFDNLDETYLGAFADLDAGTSGTFYMDEWRANDDGAEIGPAQLPAPRALYHYRRRRRVA